MESMVQERMAVIERPPVVAEAVVQVRKNPCPPPFDDPIELRRNFGAAAWYEPSRFVIDVRRRRRH